MNATDQQYREGDTLYAIARKILGLLQWFANGGPLSPSGNGCSCGADVTVGATPVRGDSVKASRGIYVSADPANVGYIYVGGQNVGTGSKGIVLAKGITSPLIQVSNLDQIYIHGSNASDTAGLLVV